jgi:hypothetical protein
MTDVPPEGDEWTSHEEVEILRQIEESEQEQEEILRKLLERADTQIELLGTISTTLSTFLADWEAANTEHPATKVILTWGPPKPIPKGD